MFSTMGFSNVRKIVGETIIPYTIGIAKAHIEAIDYLRYMDTKNGTPILILEDDVAFNSNCTYDPKNIVIPEDFPALYLGTSNFGRLRGGSHNNTAIVIGDGNYVRPINMLGMHAVLYNNHHPNYYNRIIELLEVFIENPVGGIDDLIAENMIRYEILALRNPMFYQNDGHSEETTLKPLQPIFECPPYPY